MACDVDLSTTTSETPKPKRISNKRIHYAALSPLEDVRSFLESFPGEDETAMRSRRQVEMKLNSLRKIRDYDPTTMDEDAEEYEVVIDKNTVRLLCEEEEARCRKELTLLNELSDLLDKAANQNVRFIADGDVGCGGGRRSRVAEPVLRFDDVHHEEQRASLHVLCETTVGKKEKWHAGDPSWKKRRSEWSINKHVYLYTYTPSLNTSRNPIALS